MDNFCCGAGHSDHKPPLLLHVGCTCCDYCASTCFSSIIARKGGDH